MFKTLANAWKIPELRKKMLYSVFIIFLFRLGAAIPVPFISIASTGLVNTDSGSFMNYLLMMTGEAFNYGTIFALGITPYINSSIIMQLLAVAIPALERLSKDEEGRKKTAEITRYVTVALALIQSAAYYVYIRHSKMLTTMPDGTAYTGFSAVWQAILIIAVLTAGSTLVMWLGEQINEKGIGNGVSLILFAGIVSRVPTLATQLYETMNKGGAYFWLIPLFVVILLLMIAFIVWTDSAERRIPVQYTKRVVGRKMYGGQNSHIPIKVNMSGVLPIIFAGSILSLPSTIKMFLTIDEDSGWAKFFKLFTTDSGWYSVIYFVLIIAFAYFYASIQYNPVEMANNLAKNSGSIPGVRTGRPTSDYIAKVISKIVLLGALLLSVVALTPILFTQITTACDKAVSATVGGTSIIILVGVALETVEQIKSQMMMRHYKGFLD